NKKVISLDLSENQIDDVGVAALAKSLEKNQYLKILKLNDNQIGDQGAIALSECLAKDTHLEELYLSFNQIGNGGLKALAKALRKNTNLRILDLGHILADMDAAVEFVVSLLLNEYSSLKIDNFQFLEIPSECISEVNRKFNATFKDLKSLRTQFNNSNLLDNFQKKALKEVLHLKQKGKISFKMQD